MCSLKFIHIEVLAIAPVAVLDSPFFNTKNAVLSSPVPGSAASGSPVPGSAASGSPAPGSAASGSSVLLKTHNYIASLRSVDHTDSQQPTNSQLFSTQNNIIGST